MGDDLVRIAGRHRLGMDETVLVGTDLDCQPQIPILRPRALIFTCAPRLRVEAVGLARLELAPPGPHRLDHRRIDDRRPPLGQNHALLGELRLHRLEQRREAGPPPATTGSGRSSSRPGCPRRAPAGRTCGKAGPASAAPPAARPRARTRCRARTRGAASAPGSGPPGRLLAVVDQRRRQRLPVESASTGSSALSAGWSNSSGAGRNGCELKLFLIPKSTPPRSLRNSGCFAGALSMIWR